MLLCDNQIFSAGWITVNFFFKYGGSASARHALELNY